LNKQGLNGRFVSSGHHLILPAMSHQLMAFGVKAHSLLFLLPFFIRFALNPNEYLPGRSEFWKFSKVSFPRLVLSFARAYDHKAHRSTSLSL
jgi:hypothetical protein